MARPSKIDQVVGTRTLDDGTTAPVTAFERIVGGVRVGNYFEHACASAGVHRETAYGWLRIGAQLYARAATYDTDLDTIEATDHERRCAAFSDAVAQAEAEWVVGAVTTLESLGRGGQKVETVTTKQLASGDTEITTKVETLAPNPQVIEWRLTRRLPQHYGDRVELIGGLIDGQLPMADRAEALAGEVRSYLQGRADAEQAKPKRKRKPKPELLPGGVELVE